MANFKQTNSKISLIEDFYNHFNEDERLSSRHGNIEYVITNFYLDKYLKKSHSIIELGAATGAYSIPLFNKGYNITAFELVPHNIEVLKSKNKDIRVIQGNATDLSNFKDESFDVTLIFGPLYHLVNKEDQIKCLKEAKRITKKGGLIFVSYLNSNYAYLRYGLINNHLKECLDNKMINENFEIITSEKDLYNYLSLKQINKMNKDLNLKRIEIIAQDGLCNYFRKEINALDEDSYQNFVHYSVVNSNKKEYLGYSSHFLDILRKI